MGMNKGKDKEEQAKWRRGKRQDEKGAWKRASSEGTRREEQKEEKLREKQSSLSITLIASFISVSLLSDGTLTED